VHIFYSIHIFYKTDIIRRFVLTFASVCVVCSVKTVDRCVWWKRGYNPGVAGDHMYNSTELFFIAYHDKLGTNKKQSWQCNFERDLEHAEIVRKNAEIQSAENQVAEAEFSTDLDEDIIATSEEVQIEVDEPYYPVRDRMFVFEVPADKLKDGEGKVRVFCKTHFLSIKTPKPQKPGVI